MGDYETVAFCYANIFMQMASMISILASRNSMHGCICPDLILIANGGKTLKLVDSVLIHPVIGQSSPG